MAKLNGVTMVSERIQYNGADYVKFDEKAVKGDIIRFDDSSRCINTGAFYEVTRIDRHGDPQIIDEENDEYDLCGMDIAVFKRAEAAQPLPTTLPDKYVIHDGKVYVKEARKANVGDTIIVTGNSCNHGYNIGDIKVAEERYDAGGYRKGVDCDKAYNRSQVRDGDYNVLVPTDSVTIGDAEYTLEKRKAAKGERVLVIVDAAFYKPSEIFVVERVESTN